jgi:hypothetical protein
MRRIKWPLLILCGLAVGCSLWSFLIARNDEFAFLRKFDPVQTREEIIMASTIQFERDGTTHPGGTGIWCTKLHFPKVTSELLKEIIGRSRFPWNGEDAEIILSTGRKAYFHKSDSSLIVYEEPEPSWLDVKIDSLKRSLHISSNLVYARDR